MSKPPLSYGHTHVREDITIANLASEPHPKFAGKIVDREFVECDIRWPVIIHGGRGLLMGGLAYFEDTQEEALWPLPSGDAMPDDVVLVDDCQMVGCRFHDVRFVGSVQELNIRFVYATFAGQPFRQY